MEKMEHTLKNTITRNERNDLYEAALSQQSGRVFLSVIVISERGQSDKLNELVLCLAGQENLDFELFVLMHHLDEGDRQRIDGLCNFLKEVVGVYVDCIEINGNRSGAINEAISRAKGSYFALVSEGDILFDNWVSSFFVLAEQAFGSVLNVHPLRQEWQICSGSNHIRSFKAATALSNCYYHSFDFQDQTLYNDCPSVGVAFPTNLVQDLTLAFDENLYGLAYWDFLMQAVACFGITECDNPSSIQRAWKSNTTFQKSSGKDDWDREYRIFKANVEKLSGPVKNIFNRNDNSFDRNPFSPEFYTQQCYFIVETDDSKTENKSIIKPCISEKTGFDIALVSCKMPIKGRIHFEFAKPMSFFLTSFNVSIVDKMGNEVEIPLAGCMHNGFQINSSQGVFLQEKPTITFKIPSHIDAVEVHIAISACRAIDNDSLLLIVRSKYSLFVGRCWRYLKRKIRLG